MALSPIAVETRFHILGIWHIRIALWMGIRSRRKPCHRICQRWNRISDSAPAVLLLKPFYLPFYESRRRVKALKLFW